VCHHTVMEDPMSAVGKIVVVVVTPIASKVILMRNLRPSTHPSVINAQFTRRERGDRAA